LKIERVLLEMSEKQNIALRRLDVLKSQFVAATYTSPPWIQTGDGYVHTFEAKISAARKLIPSCLDIVETSPGSGRTLGSIYIAKYNPPSPVLYNELSFSAATVRYKGQEGSHGFYYVDDDEALVQGWNVWGIEKEMATFHWSTAASGGSRVYAVDSKGNVVCDMSFPKPVKSFPFKQTPSCFSIKQKGAAYGNFNINEPHSILLSKPQQAFSLGMLKAKGGDIQIPFSSKFYEVYSTSINQKSLMMGDATFNMGAPEQV
jgi:hypothetical protein